MEFKKKYEDLVVSVNKALDEYMTIEDGPGSSLHKAMRYSLMAEGKRLRPVLALATCELLDGGKNDVMPFACAIEMIHTYSLIHDDLPAMDNDDYRRGIPTNHKVFGEALAILAGDALLNKAYEVMLSGILESCFGLKEKLRAMQIIAANAGAGGMIRGQTVDLESEGKSISKVTLEYMHRCKTGALIKAPILASAVICGASADEYRQLEIYAENIGLAFQIKDDIMDVKGSREQMGKDPGSDAAAGKSTYVTLFGVEEAEKLLDKAIMAAISALDIFGEKAAFLKEMAIFIRNRNS